MCGRQPLILMKISLAHPQLRKEYWTSTMCDSSSPLVNFPVGGTGWCETWIPFLFCAVDVGVGFRILLPGCCGSWIKIIEELFRNGLLHLVISGVVLRGIFCKAVRYEENITKTPFDSFSVQKMGRYYFKRIYRCVIFHRCSFYYARFLMSDATALITRYTYR